MEKNKEQNLGTPVNAEKEKAKELNMDVLDNIAGGRSINYETENPSEMGGALSGTQNK